MPDLYLIEELSERVSVSRCEQMTCFDTAFSWRCLVLTKINLTRYCTVCDVFYNWPASVVVLKDFHVVVILTYCTQLSSTYHLDRLCFFESDSRFICIILRAFLLPREGETFAFESEQWPPPNQVIDACV